MINKVYIIAEAGVNHNGSVDLALKLCDEAKWAGADAVKFQTWKTDLIITKDTRMAGYQIENVKNRKSQYDMLKELELSYDTFTQIKKHCDEIGIQFLSTADEEESLDFLICLGVPFIKLGSGDITNVPYLRLVGKKNLPVILSTGMSYLSDVERAILILRDCGVSEIILLHCTTNYPCPMEEVNLNAMQTLKCAFKFEVGYSDHTMGIEVPIAAVAMGATVIEKHFTLDRLMEGPDHKASLEPQEFRRMVLSIRNIEMALGTGCKEPNLSEKKIAPVVLKKIVAKQKIQKGECFTGDNLTVKRSSLGLDAKYWDLVIGEKTCKDYLQDDGIDFQF